MRGQICDHCDERRASYGINKIEVRTNAATGHITSASRDEDWCEECCTHHRDYWDKSVPNVGDTWSENGTWRQGKDGGKYTVTYTIEKSPHKAAPVMLSPACPCCGQEWIGQEHWKTCTGCANPEHSHA